MSTIGETLRETRMRQKLDVADVESRTKIRAKYLRALENEEFGLLPGPTFVKTFLRTYAELLGLDPHVLVEEYRASYDPDEDQDPAARLGPPAAAGTRERDRRRGGGRSGPGRGVVVAALVAVVLAFLAVLGLTGENNDKADEGPGTTTTMRESPRPSRTRRAPRPAASSVTLRIAPEQPTYACIDTGPGTDVLFEGTLERARSFKAKRLRLNLGKTAVGLTVNGRPLTLDSSPDPAGFELTPRGRKPLPEGERPCA